jgi:hypothetical protein
LAEVQVGDFVQRLKGTGNFEYGRTIAPVEDAVDEWLVTAGGLTFRDHASQLLVLVPAPDVAEWGDPVPPQQLDW